MDDNPLEGYSKIVDEKFDYHKVFTYICNMKKHPLSSVETFQEWLSGFGCVNCKFLDNKDLPIEERKCTHEYAFKACDEYENGLEADKEWIRQDDIRRENVGDRSLPLPRRDVNLFFMCPFFDDEGRLLLNGKGPDC